MNYSENKTSSDLHKLLLNILNKINLNRSDRNVAISNLSLCHTF